MRLILIAVAALGLLYLATRSTTVKPSDPGRPVSPEELALRTQIATQVKDLLANGQDPNAMEAVATTIEPYGFPEEVAQLRARASQLRQAS